MQEEDKMSEYQGTCFVQNERVERLEQIELVGRNGSMHTVSLDSAFLGEEALFWGSHSGDKGTRKSKKLTGLFT